MSLIQTVVLARLKNTLLSLESTIAIVVTLDAKFENHGELSGDKRRTFAFCQLVISPSMWVALVRARGLSKIASFFGNNLSPLYF